MHINWTNISCGIKRLSNIKNNITEMEYNNLINAYAKAIVIAGVNTKYKRAVRFLEERGFVPVNKSNKSKTTLLVKHFN